MPEAASPGPTERPTARLTTLGSAQLSRESPGREPVAILGAGKPLALLTYLALSSRRTATRDHLLELLWADVTPDRGRRTLRQTLWQLRQKLGGDALELEGDAVKLTLDLSFDRDEFVTAVRDGRDERALELYRGKFFPAFAAPGAAEFERWADLERARLHAAYERVVERYVTYQIAHSNFKAAERAARALRDMDPARERAWRLLLETLLASGSREAAQIEADGLQATLAAEGGEPEAATRALLDQLPAPKDAGAAPPSVQVTSGLVGRETEFAAVLEAWQEVRRGSARHVHVTGAEGMGKTQLLRELAGRIRAAGGTVVRLGAEPGERGIGYTFVRHLAGALAALPGAAAVAPEAAATLVELDPALASRFPGVMPRAHSEDPERDRAAALGQLLAAVAEEAPVAVFIDDVHWVDPASRQLLSAVAGRLPQGALLVTAAPPIAEGDSGSQLTARVILEPFTEAQILEVIQSLAELPRDAAWASALPHALARLTSGSPLLVLDALRRLQDRGLLTIADGEWHCSDSAAVWRQLERGPLWQRKPWVRRYATAGVAAVAGAIVLGLVIARSPRLFGRAGLARLAVVTVPVATVPGTGQLLPAPIVELRRGSGAMDSSGAPIVTAELAAGTGVLSGAVSVAARDGRAVFDDLRLTGSGTFALRFTAPGFEPIQTPEFWLGNEAEGSWLRLVGGEVNGQKLSPEQRRVVVEPGDVIDGKVDLVYTSRWGAAAVMLGATVTWGDPASNVITIAPLNTPALNMPRTAPVHVVAPRQPGTYRLILVFQAEPNLDYILSATNWTVGRPVWGDGNDVARWSPEQLAAADRAGQVVVRQLWPGGRWVENWFQATTVQVVVRSR